MSIFCTVKLEIVFFLFKGVFLLSLENTWNVSIYICLFFRKEKKKWFFIFYVLLFAISIEKRSFAWWNCWCCESNRINTFCPWDARPMYIELLIVSSTQLLNCWKFVWFFFLFFLFFFSLVKTYLFISEVPLSLIM